MSTLPMAGSLMGQEYGKASGTSMACPFVSGTAALIWTLHPELKHTQVRDRLKTVVDDLGDRGRDNDYGWGRINLSKAAI
jgi:subtilisin family serine protease